MPLPEGPPPVEHPPASGYPSLLMESVLDFNLGRDRFLDASWMPDHAAWIPVLESSACPAARRSFSRWIVRRFRLARQVDYAFDRPGKRLFLLDRTRLQSLAWWLGACLAAPALAMQLDRRTTLARRGLIEDPALHELLGLQAKHPLPCAWSIDSAPECRLAGPPTAQAFADLGGCALLALAREAGPAVAWRTRLKLPRGLRRSGCAVRITAHPDAAMGSLQMLARAFLPDVDALLDA